MGSGARRPESRCPLCCIWRPVLLLLGRYPGASPDALDLLRHMLAFFPEDRVTAEVALAHPFFGPIRRVEKEVGGWVVVLSI
jgi:hypothetical protein